MIGVDAPDRGHDAGAATDRPMPAGVGSYGIVPDPDDDRDFRSDAKPVTQGKLPSSVNLSSNVSYVQTQGNLQSCTACAVTSAMAFELGRAGHATSLSALFLYYVERTLRHQVGADSGGGLRDACKAAARWGACTESTWPYLPDRVEKRPPKSAYTQALRHRVASYERLAQRLDELRRCLASGRPFLFAFSAHTGFESEGVTRTGRLHLPGRERFLGNHAVMCVGYEDVGRQFLVLNSWGPDWGQHGFFQMPYLYLLDSGLARDFWIINADVNRARRP